MSIICPTVTAFDLETYNSQLKLVSSFAKRIHVDLMDGVFTPTKSPDISELWVPGNVVVDIHVMYLNPDSIMDQLIAFNPHLIIVHTESNADIIALATRLKNKDIQTGIALLPPTQVADIEAYLPYVQHSLIFGGHLGYHGGEADLQQLSKVQTIKSINNSIEVSWDGGANNSNCMMLKDSGIDVINVGSGIHKADNPKKAYLELTQKVDQ